MPQKEPRRISLWEKITVFVFSVIAAWFVFWGSGYGYFLAPLLVIFFNAAVLLYDGQQRKTADQTRA